MTRVYCDVNPDNIRRNPGAEEIDVLVYRTKSHTSAGVAIGHQVLDEIGYLEAPISQRAFDFLTLSIAVTAADTFVKRDEAADGWSREFELIVPISEPDIWESI